MNPAARLLHRAATAFVERDERRVAPRPGRPRWCAGGLGEGFGYELCADLACKSCNEIQALREPRAARIIWCDACARWVAWKHLPVPSLRSVLAGLCESVARELRKEPPT